MSTTTINTFPALHSFDSPRGWILALIVLLHVGFVWALNNGLSFSKLVFKPTDMVTRIIEPQRREPPPDDVILKPNVIDTQRPVIVPNNPPVAVIDDPEPTITGTVPADPPIASEVRSDPHPVLVEPAIPSAGLTEPLYPASAIRAGHEGTVLLSLEVLENGRVGRIRLMQSSGFASLDRSAMREARKWRFVPGTRDGIPVVRWKEVPVKFELEERR